MAFNTKLTELGDLIEIHDSRRVPLSGIVREQRPGPYPYYGAAKIFDYLDDFIFDGDFILVGEDGSVVREDGTPFVQYASGRFWANNHTHVLRPRDGEIDFWYLKSVLERTDISGFVTGAAQPKLNQANLKRIPIPVPSVDIQSTIGALARITHEGIENNLRRIEILEEMAQTIYREWFVNFRFPGHVTKSLPSTEDWERSNLFDVAEVRYGFGFKSGLFHGGPSGHRVVRIRNVPKNTSTTYTDEHPGHNYEIVDGDILVGMDGEFHMCVWHDGGAMLNQRVARFRPRIDVPTLWLFHALRKPIYYFNATITGTTVAHLGDRHLKTVELLVPPEPLMVLARKQFDPMEKAIQNLLQQNRNLRATRDLLLPKLISGEIDVSELDIDTSWLAA